MNHFYRNEKLEPYIEGEPFFEATDDGDKYWFNAKGQIHREDGPAIEYYNGTKHWMINGKIHREDGPACEYYNGTKHWMINGKIHREDGPAIEMGPFGDDDNRWYLDDIFFESEEQWKIEIEKRKPVFYFIGPHNYENIEI